MTRHGRILALKVFSLFLAVKPITLCVVLERIISAKASAENITQRSIIETFARRRAVALIIRTLDAAADSAACGPEFLFR